MPRSVAAHPVEETLARLGVEELEERLEHAPLLPGDGAVESDACCNNFCNCRVEPPVYVDGKPVID